MWLQFSWLNPSETETWRNVAETDSDSATTETFRILPKSNVSQLKTDFDSACFVVVFNLKFLSTFLNMLPIQRLRDLLRLRLRLLQLRRRSLVLSWEKSREFRKRACYIRTLYQNREQNGEFFRVVMRMRSEDPEKHFEYFRMNKESFDEILQAITPYIKHKNNHRHPITPIERLSVTLR